MQYAGNLLPIESTTDITRRVAEGARYTISSPSRVHSELDSCIAALISSRIGTASAESELDERKEKPNRRTRLPSRYTCPLCVA